MPVTIDISAKDIKLVSFKGNQVEKWGTAPLAPGIVRDGQILEPKVVGAKIDTLFKSLDIPKTSAIATITGLSSTYRIIRLPRLKVSSISEAILRVAKKEIPLPLEEIYFSWRTIGGNEDEVELFLFGVPRNLIDAIVQTFNVAGVRLLSLDLKSLALARVANRPDALVVNFESDSFDIVLIAEGLPTILHSVVPRADGATPEDNVRRLVDELSRTVDFFNSTHASNPIRSTTPLLLNGELASNPSNL